MRTHVSRSYSFGTEGNAAEIQISGWSATEPKHTWCLSKRSIVAIDVFDAPHGFFLEIDWYPFVSHPYRPDQSVIITVSDYEFRPYNLTRRETSAFFCPPPARNDKKILITFDHPDAAKISEYITTNDSREVAIAFRRLRIIPLDEPPPIRLHNHAAFSIKIDSDYLTTQTTAGTKRVGIHTLLSTFEVLAGNCDLGLCMRALNFERLSLLRFAGATAEVAIRGLESDFQGIGEHLSAEIVDNPIKEWMIKDAFGLRFHTHQPSEAIGEAAILNRQRRHIGFLRRKFLEDVQIAEKIFVYADHTQPTTFRSALALFLALNRRGRHRMLWVCPNFGEMASGRVDELLPGLARGSLGLFDGPLEAGHIAVHGWLKVLFNAAMVLDRSGAGLVP